MSYSSGFIFLEKAIQTEIVETFSLAKAGDTVDNFNYQVKAKSKTLIFLKKNLEDFGREFILAQIPEGKKLYEESLKIDFTPETINLNSEKIILSLNISAKIYSDVDLSALKNNLKGKSLTEIKIFLRNQPWIIKSEIEFWPFWVRKVPDKLDKIKLELRINTSTEAQYQP